MALRQLELVVAQPVEPEAAVVLLASRLASSHHWSRELQAIGPTVRLMPPAYVKRHKNDSVDAEAICEDKQNSN
jgi:transposase